MGSTLTLQWAEQMPAPGSNPFDELADCIGQLNNILVAMEVGHRFDFLRDDDSMSILRMDKYGATDGEIASIEKRKSESAVFGSYEFFSNKGFYQYCNTLQVKHLFREHLVEAFDSGTAAWLEEKNPKLKALGVTSPLALNIVRQLMSNETTELAQAVQKELGLINKKLVSAKAPYRFHQLTSGKSVVVYLDGKANNQDVPHFTHVMTVTPWKEAERYRDQAVKYRVSEDGENPVAEDLPFDLAIETLQRSLLSYLDPGASAQISAQYVLPPAKPPVRPEADLRFDL